METARFISRDRCLSCRSSALTELSSGSFDDDPLHDFIAKDPWGENPLPFLKGLRWSYVRCEDCGLTFHRRVLDAEWAARKFERWMSAKALEQFEREHCTADQVFGRAIHFAKHALQLRALGVRTVLDFGCGNGGFIEQCRLFGLHAVGLDRSAARAEKNRGKIYADVSEIGTERFDAITLFEVLEHLDDPRGVLESLIPLTQPRAVLILETPDATNVTGIRSFHDYQMIHPLDHINGFTPRTLREFAERLGFDSIPQPVSHITTDLIRVAKTEAKRWLPMRARTQQYFKMAPRAGIEPAT